MFLNDTSVSLTHKSAYNRLIYRAIPLFLYTLVTYVDLNIWLLNRCSQRARSPLYLITQARHMTEPPFLVFSHFFWACFQDASLLFLSQDLAALVIAYFVPITVK